MSTLLEDNLILLSSVGSCMDINGMVYPMFKNGAPDKDAGIHIKECTKEWHESLSKDDSQLITKYN